MSDFLDIDTSDATEPTAVDAGEYMVSIIGFRKDGEENIIRTDKNGGKYIMPMFELPEHVSAKSFSTFIRIPDSSTMEGKALEGAKWQLEAFKRAFGVPEGGFDLNDLIGTQGYALLYKEDTDDYGEQNGIKKFIAPAQ